MFTCIMVLVVAETEVNKLFLSHSSGGDLLIINTQYLYLLVKHSETPVRLTRTLCSQ